VRGYERPAAAQYRGRSGRGTNGFAPGGRLRYHSGHAR
jgi:hypothetical protein